MYVQAATGRAWSKTARLLRTGRLELRWQARGADCGDLRQGDRDEGQRVPRQYRGLLLFSAGDPEGQCAHRRHGQRKNLPAGRKIDRAGGIAFGIRDWDNYFVLRINALESNIILFEFRNGKRHKMALVERQIDAATWHDLRVEIAEGRIQGFFDGDPVIFSTPEISCRICRSLDQSGLDNVVRLIVIEKNGDRKVVEL